MASSEGLSRLLQLRALEEEQHKLALESVLSELPRIDSARNAAYLRVRAGRRQIAGTAQSTEIADRIAGMVECESAERDTRLLEIRLFDAHRRAAELREAYLAKRAERRQVETMLEESKAKQALEEARLDQQSVDEWFNARRHARESYGRGARKLDTSGGKEGVGNPEQELRSQK